MTSLRTRYVQATAGRPHGPSFQAKNRKSTSSNVVPGVFASV